MPSENSEYVALPPLPCRASPPQGGRLAGAFLLLPISPLEGEMSAQLTEGGIAATPQIHEQQLPSLQVLPMTLSIREAVRADVLTKTGIQLDWEIKRIGRPV